MLALAEFAAVAWEGQQPFLAWIGLVELALLVNNLQWVRGGFWSFGCGPEIIQTKPFSNILQLNFVESRRL
jgi:hypothetical protein